jgi:hypothetical protein
MGSCCGDGFAMDGLIENNTAIDGVFFAAGQLLTRHNPGDGLLLHYTYR